jgi:hypothetical protein
MKIRLIRVTPGTPLPLSDLRVNIKASKVLRAFLWAALAMVWTGASSWFVHHRRWDDSWYGIGLVLLPMIVFLGQIVRFLAQGFAVNFRRHLARLFCRRLV